MSGPQNYDRVLVATTTTGTGTLTLGSAVTGHQVVPAAADGKLVRATVFAVDGSGVPTGDWETFIGVYTHSGTTLTRGTFKGSSTGSAVNFAAGTKYVAISSIAASMQSTAAGTDAAATLVANTDLELDASILTADRILTLPVASAGVAIGDIIEVGIAGSNASYEAIIKTGAGETCEFGGGQIAAATEITRLFITGEWLRFKKVSATKWRAYDGRIAQRATLRLSTNATGEGAAGVSIPTGYSGAWAAEVDIGGVAVTATGDIKTRRDAKVQVCAGGASVSGLADVKYWNIFLYKNGTGTTTITGGSILHSGKHTNSGTGNGQISVPAITVPFVADDYVRFAWRSEEGSKGIASSSTPICTTFMSLLEIL